MPASTSEVYKEVGWFNTASLADRGKSKAWNADDEFWAITKAEFIVMRKKDLKFSCYKLTNVLDENEQISDLL